MGWVRSGPFCKLFLSFGLGRLQNRLKCLWHRERAPNALHIASDNLEHRAQALAFACFQPGKNVGLPR